MALYQIVFDKKKKKKMSEIIRSLQLLFKLRKTCNQYDMTTKHTTTFIIYGRRKCNNQVYARHTMNSDH